MTSRVTGAAGTPVNALVAGLRARTPAVPTQPDDSLTTTVGAASLGYLLERRRSRSRFDDRSHRTDYQQLTSPTQLCHRLARQGTAGIRQPAAH